jgi:hypothetical protein
MDRICSMYGGNKNANNVLTGLAQEEEEGGRGRGETNGTLSYAPVRFPSQFRAHSVRPTCDGCWCCTVAFCTTVLAKGDSAIVLRGAQGSCRPPLQQSSITLSVARALCFWPHYVCRQSNMLTGLFTKISAFRTVCQLSKPPGALQPILTIT